MTAAFNLQPFSVLETSVGIKRPNMEGATSVATKGKPPLGAFLSRKRMILGPGGEVTFRTLVRARL